MLHADRERYIYPVNGIIGKGSLLPNVVPLVVYFSRMRIRNEYTFVPCTC